jgi:hypothetical protein
MPLGIRVTTKPGAAALWNGTTAASRPRHATTRPPEAAMTPSQSRNVKPRPRPAPVPCS